MIKVGKILQPLFKREAIPNGMAVTPLYFGAL